jgi:cell fate regulator YaaT (PSP1 superfamily)
MNPVNGKNNMENQTKNNNSPAANNGNKVQHQPKYGKHNARRPLKYYRIQFRPEGQIHTAGSKIAALKKGEVVMVQTDHGQEPAKVFSLAPSFPKEADVKPSSAFIVARRGTRDEMTKYERLGEMEDKAFSICSAHIRKQNLPMNLVSVERFFNGSKIIFYFTAESRVDFRELVKVLVQEFRTRVEMRQIGVRHETKMVGGLGCCGRELCCSSFIKNFESVSIKMAKEQNLPLNPNKISGACNRLLCCLNYEFKTYKDVRKKMPKIGKEISMENVRCKVRQHNVLKETITVIHPQEGEITLTKEEWQKVKPVASQKK